VYECDEFDRNFLHYSPTLSLVTGVAWDHPDIYPSQADYDQAFRDFCQQSATNVLWQSDVDRLGLKRDAKTIVLSDTDQKMGQIKLAGAVNRRNAWQVAMALATLPLTSTAQPAVNLDMLVSILEQFPGVSRRFEQIVPGLYNNYAHTPEKVLGALQLGHEVAGKNLVVVYEGLHNTRQHFIRKQLVNLFSGVKQLYVVPSYRARENTLLEDLTPKKLIASMNPTVQAYAAPAELGTDLRERLQTHLAGGDTVLCLTAGGGGSLDEWLRQEFAS
jgi:UDP-N-acetylmuramate--alanine ligase